MHEKVESRHCAGATYAMTLTESLEKLLRVLVDAVAQQDDQAHRGGSSWALPQR